jgi:hypothetical protein
MTQHYAHELTMHKQYDKCQDRQVMYRLRNTEARASNYPCEKRIKQHILPICARSLSYTVKNNHVTCHIAVIGLSSIIKINTTSYHVYKLEKTVINIKYVLNCSDNFYMKFLY